MTKEKLINGLKEAKDYIFAVFIFILFSLPFFKEYYPTSIFFNYVDYSILAILGTIGVYAFIINLIIKLYKSDNKKEFFKENLPIFLLFLFMLWTLFSSILAEDKETAFLGTSYRKDGYISYLAYAGVFGLAFCIDSKKIKKILIYSFVIIAIITIILVQFANYKNLDYLVSNLDIRTTSFSQFNHYGYYLLIACAFSSFLFISEKNIIAKIINFLMYSFLLYFLILNDTFGCYLALISTFVFFFIMTFIKKEKKLYIILAILIFAIISVFGNKNANEQKQNIASQNLQTFAKDIKNICTTNPSDKSWESAGTGRMILWKYGIKFFLEKPILGLGPENIGNRYYDLRYTSR